MLTNGVDVDKVAGVMAPAPRKSRGAPVTKAAVKPRTVKTKVVMSTLDTPSGAPTMAQTGIDPDEIAQLAYLMWEARGYSGGSPERDWALAEAYLTCRSKTR